MILNFIRNLKDLNPKKGFKLKKLIVSFILFFLIFGCIDLTGLIYSSQCGDGVCDESEQNSCLTDCDPGPRAWFLQTGDELINLTGSNDLEGKTLSLRVDDFKRIDEFTVQVKLSLLDNSKSIASKYFNEYSSVEDFYSIKDEIFVSEIEINEARNREKVQLDLIPFNKFA